MSGGCVGSSADTTIGISEMDLLREFPRSYRFQSSTVANKRVPWFASDILKFLRGTGFNGDCLCRSDVMISRMLILLALVPYGSSSLSFELYIDLCTADQPPVISRLSASGKSLKHQWQLAQPLHVACRTQLWIREGPGTVVWLSIDLPSW